MTDLGSAEAAVLAVLRDATPRIVSRRELVRRAGLRDRSPRRADAIVSRLRHVLGSDSIRTVRSRGWAFVGDGAADETMVRFAASCDSAHCACSLALATARPAGSISAPGGAIQGAADDL
jgi:DNA-binding winged helix-turn-helix (wHTH) protein